MRLTRKNTYIEKHKEGYSVNIQMPDGSRNYLHCKETDLESAIIIQDLLVDTSIDHMNIRIIDEEKYFRLIASIQDVNENITKFHSRKLNLIDVIYERRLLIEED